MAVPDSPPLERNLPIATQRRIALALAANQVLASATHIFAKGAVTALGALPVALLRFAIASITLGGWQRVRGVAGIEKRDWPRVALLGFLVVPLNQGFFLFGMVRSTPSHASLLYALTPLVVFLLARVMIRERTPWSALAGILIAFAGVILILTERGLRNEMAVLRGDLLILVAVFAWALYTVLSKPLLVRYDPMAVTTGAIVSGTLMTLPALLIPGALPPIRSLSLPIWGAILYLAIGTSAIAYPLYMYALRHLDTAKVAVAQNTQPVITSILSWLVFRERFSPAFFLGAGLILAGVTWVETRRAKE
jgi:drug/metabolite transporter (DMT)-like permease